MGDVERQWEGLGGIKEATGVEELKQWEGSRGSGRGQEAVGGAKRQWEGLGVPPGGEAVQYDKLLMFMEHIFVSTSFKVLAELDMC